MSETGIGVPSDRIVSFQDAIKLGFSNYANFQGRSSRGAYWYFTLFMFVAGVVLGFIDGIIFSGNALSPISSLFTLATFIPAIAIGVRRLHDIGKSGWWTLIALTGIGIILLIIWAVQAGDRNDNAHGPDKEAGR